MRRWVKPEGLWAPARCVNAFGHGHGHGVGGGIAWTPASLVQPGDQWLWADLDAAGAVTKPADPTIPGAGWSGANWVGSGLGPYTHTAGATTALTNAVLTVGLRYLVRFTVTGRTAGTVTLTLGATSGAARSTNATFTEELTCTTSTGLSFVPSNDFDGAVTVVYAVAITVNLVTCKGTLGNISRATPAQMPWVSDPDAPTSVPVNGRKVLYGEVNADLLDHAGFLNFLHDGTGMTFVAVVDTGASGLVVQSVGAATDVGMNISVAPGRLIAYRVANGSGAWSVDQTSAAQPAGKSSLIVRMNAAAYSVRFAGSSILAGAPGAVSAANSVLVPRHFSSLFGTAGRFLINRYLSDTECLKMEAYLRSYYALP